MYEFIPFGGGVHACLGHHNGNDDDGILPLIYCAGLTGRCLTTFVQFRSRKFEIISNSDVRRVPEV